MSDFTGRGWRFPIVPDAGGDLRYVDGDENVEQSLWLLLATGCGRARDAPALRHERARARVRARVAGEPEGARGEHRGGRRADYEPRVRLERVAVVPDPEEAERVDIEVTYTVRPHEHALQLRLPVLPGPSGRDAVDERHRHLGRHARVRRPGQARARRTSRVHRRREWTLHGAGRPRHHDPRAARAGSSSSDCSWPTSSPSRWSAPACACSGSTSPAAARAAVAVLSVTAPAAANPVPAGTVFDLERDAAGRRVRHRGRRAGSQPVAAVEASGRLLGRGRRARADAAHDDATRPPPTASCRCSSRSPRRRAWRPRGGRTPSTSSRPRSCAGGDRPGGDERAGRRARWHGQAAALRAADVPLAGGLGRGGRRRRRACAPIATRASYTEPVRIVAVSPNAVVARHRVAASPTSAAARRASCRSPNRSSSCRRRPGTCSTAKATSC